MKKTIAVLVQLLVCGLCFAEGKSTDDKEATAIRPSVFPELDKAGVLCMKACPVKITEFMDVKVLCGNYSRAEYDKSCADQGVEVAQYCNCNKSDCARFSVACSVDGKTCHVAMLAQGIQPLMCECGGRTCEQAAIESSLSTCIIRRDTNSRTCSLDSYGTLADGNALYTDCDTENSCVSQQVQTAVMNKQPMTTAKPGEPK